jgi:hypothetical protein
MDTKLTFKEIVDIMTKMEIDVQHFHILFGFYHFGIYFREIGRRMLRALRARQIGCNPERKCNKLVFYGFKLRVVLFNMVRHRMEQVPNTRPPNIFCSHV